MTQDHLRIALANTRLPRYTSYPPANRFSSAVGPDRMAAWLGDVAAGADVSLYVHLPFCRRLCWFCACRTQGTRSAASLDRYLDHLEIEIASVRKHLPRKVRISQLHLGGGTPTLLSPGQLKRLAGMLRPFGLDAADEISVEIDPCEFDGPRLRALIGMGLSRGSLGVQDFHPVVQSAIGRTQGHDVTETAVRMLREAGIDSINMDLLYGLPHQTPARLSSTLERVLDLKPDRIALYGYAHVPWMARRQKLISESDLPGPEDRIELEAVARARLTGAGYLPLGIDHYALPDDAMARASKAGRLRRNFQGYTTDTAEVLIGLGASAISRFPQGYTQNTAPTGAWQDAVARGHLATARGYILEPQDRATGAIIERLMCDGEADITRLCRSNGVDPEAFLKRTRDVIDRLPGAARLENGTVRLASLTYARPVAAGLEASASEGSGFSMAI